MISVNLPKTNKVTDSITFDDVYIDPDYMIDRSFDPSLYNEEHMPVMRLYEPHYSKEKYMKMIEIKEEAKKKYEEWIAKAPWFVDIKLV